MRRVGAEMKFLFTIIQIQIKLTFFPESTFGVKLREENREKREKLTWKVSWNSCFVNSYLTKRWNGSLISSSKQVVQIVKSEQKYFLEKADPFDVAKELLTNSSEDISNNCISIKNVSQGIKTENAFSGKHIFIIKADDSKTSFCCVAKQAKAVLIYVSV